MPLKLLAAIAVGAAVVAYLALRIKRRLALSRAKHRSLTGHVKMAKRIAGLLPFYEYDERRFFRSDDAPEAVAATRRDAFYRLSAVFKDRFAKSRALTAEMRQGVSDLQFTHAYRVPFQYSRLVRENLTGARPSTHRRA